MGFIDFVRSRYFWINVFIAIILLFAIVKFTMGSLKGFTHHGESITVPDMHDLTVAEAEGQLKALKLGYYVNDSSYIVGKKPDMILDQDPAAGSKVKEGRKIYLTINAKLPPKVKMPNLIDKSLRQAQLELQSYGLQVGEIQYRPDLALNAVLDQLYRGKHVESGQLVQKGSRIDLILGNGLGETKVEVPNLIGLTYEEAKWTLMSYSLNVGLMERDASVTDTATAVVYKQVPDYNADEPAEINYGEAVDIYLTQHLPEFLERFSAKDTTQHD